MPKKDKILEKLIAFSERIYSANELVHSVALYKEVNELNLDEKSLTTAFLIQSKTKNKDIRKILSREFGSEIVNNVELLKRLDNVSFPETQKMISNLRQLFIELTDDLSIIFIKLSERLLALKTAEKKADENIKVLSEECLYLYSPIAHRLGIRKIYTEMEDISFKHLHPQEYASLNRAVKKRGTDYELKLKTMSANLKTKLNIHDLNVSIHSRVKRLYSIYRKVKNKNVNLDEIFDLLALRVITKTPEDCYLALGVVHSNWVPIEGRFRDWITYPKPNGYRSIQTTIHSRKGDKYEIQIRTDEMHRESEYGSAAHWAYKEGMSKADEGIMRVKEFLENDEYFENPGELFEQIQAESTRKYINVLTPKGQIKSLTEGSTTVDFAFAVHTHLGYKITGARVNGKFVKLKTILKSGDVIDVISSPNSTPSRDWLNFVATSRARSKIMRWFKKNEKDQLIIDGKKEFEKLKIKYRNNIKGYDSEQSLKSNLIKIGYKHTDDLYVALAGKYIKSSRTLLRKLYPKAFEKSLKKKVEKPGKRKVVDNSPQIRVEGLDFIKTSLAKCCNPIKGESIVAYITKRSEIKIHRKDCQWVNTVHFERDHFRKAEWYKDDSIQTAKVKIIGDSFTKMLALVADRADDESLVILSTEKIKVSGQLEGLMLQLEVKNIQQLEKLTNKIKTDKVVVSVKIL